MDADILALLCRKAIKDTVIEFNKERQQIACRPRIPRVIPRREPAFREVHYDVGRTSRKARPNVFLAFVDDVLLELLARITRYISIELVKQIHHRWGDYRLMKRLVRHC